MTPEQRIKALRRELESALEGAGAPEELQALRVRFLGRKQGAVTQVMALLKDAPAGERPSLGRLANELKVFAEEAFEAREVEIARAGRGQRLRAEALDVTLPGGRTFLGRRHPLTTVQEELEEIFVAMGFSIESGPEVESDFYNFEALNIPKDHPARDMQDTFFLEHGALLRTHTSPVQIRTMLKKKPPLQVIAPGKVYRRDYDIRHTPMFVQIEGLAVGPAVTFSNLKATLEHFARRFFCETTRLRFRPSFFPFTEPSAEVDVACAACGGKGCRLCGGSGWIEILGAGMVHPNVFRAVDIDPERWTGFAFGLGVDRMAVLKYGINDSRQFYENDLRFLRQFPP
jgi:phenylalanyl-tRNA synthetase alpha chain